ncbi:MAG: hypothetical protein R3200_16795 [Xanthomonadales bacterium]|nr:hypothetical protein [Xanthomonadales bacterium]
MTYRHGCGECRNLFGWDSMDQREIPSLLQSAQSVLNGREGVWAERFWRCRRCRAWWAVVFNPKDLIYDKTPVRGRIEHALKAEATLDEAWPFLFAHAPVDEMFEDYLYAGRFDPQEALDRLLEKFSDPSATPGNQYDILRMLSRLLSLQHPEHRELQARQGWVWAKTPDEDKFRRPLIAFERRFETEAPGYRGLRVHAHESMRALRAALDRDASGARKIFRGATPTLDWRREDVP